MHGRNRACYGRRKRHPHEIAEEKPLIKVCGKPVIEYVIAALKGAEKIDSIVVAVTDCTPKTAKYLSQFPVKVIETPGKDYVSDMGYASQNLKLGVFLAIAADFHWSQVKLWTL